MSTNPLTLQVPTTLAAEDAKGAQESSATAPPRPPTPFEEFQGQAEKASANPGPESPGSPGSTDDVASPQGVDGITPVVPEKDADGEGTALCQQGKHEYRARHGVMGILMAIACFPCGLICFFRDKEDVCVRCGALRE